MKVSRQVAEEGFRMERPCSNLLRCWIDGASYNSCISGHRLSQVAGESTSLGRACLL